MKKLLIASLCSLGLASAFFLAVDTNKGFTVASGGGYVKVTIPYLKTTSFHKKFFLLQPELTVFLKNCNNRQNFY